MLGQIALVKGEHMLMAFRGSTNEEVLIITEAGSDRDDRRVTLGWDRSIGEGTIFSNEGLVEQ